MVSNRETIETQLLRVFVAVSRNSGVTAAADALGIAKSAVSKQLSALEARLQVRLFERASRRIALTAEGRLLLPRAESILAELDQFLDDAGQRVALVNGTVRIAASPEFGAFLAEHFVPALLKSHPGLRVAMSLEYRFDDLHDPVVDLAFRLGSLNDDRLVARPLGEFARALVCSASFARAHRLETPAQLEQVNALMFSTHELAEVWPLVGRHDRRRRHDASVRGSLGVRGFEALAAAAAAGLGVARLPLFVAAPRLALGSLVRVLPAWQPTAVPVFLAYRAGVSRVGRVRAVIDLALSEIPRMLSTLGEM